MVECSVTIVWERLGVWKAERSIVRGGRDKFYGVEREIYGERTSSMEREIVAPAVV